MQAKDLHYRAACKEVNYLSLENMEFDLDSKHIFIKEEDIVTYQHALISSIYRGNKERILKILSVKP
jgi:hypothetical protein